MGIADTAAATKKFTTTVCSRGGVTREAAPWASIEARASDADWGGITGSAGRHGHGPTRSRSRLGARPTSIPRTHQSQSWGRTRLQPWQPSSRCAGCPRTHPCSTRSRWGGAGQGNEDRRHVSPPRSTAAAQAVTTLAPRMRHHAHERTPSWRSEAWRRTRLVCEH